MVLGVGVESAELLGVVQTRIRSCRAHELGSLEVVVSLESFRQFIPRVRAVSVLNCVLLQNGHPSFQTLFSVDSTARPLLLHTFGLPGGALDCIWLLEI